MERPQPGPDQNVTGNDNPVEDENCAQNPLTCIHETYTLASTSEGGEVDKLMIKQFLDTLAEVALMVATRKLNDRERGDAQW